MERDPGALELAPLLAASYARLGRREDARSELVRWRPEASQSELQFLTSSYHFPYRWASSDRAINARLADGLYIAALPLDLTVATLVEALQKDDAVDRSFAAQDLGRFGPGAAEAVPALIDALADQDRWVRTSVVQALGKIGPAAAAAIPTLTAMQDDDTGNFAKQALKDIRGY